MSKELTEQWRNGELKIRFYYVKLKNGAITTDFYAPMMFNGEFCYGFFKFEDEVKEVLDEVPSYKEWVKNRTWYTEKSHNELLKKVEELEKQRKETNNLLLRL